MPYEFYKLLHVLSIFVMLISMTVLFFKDQNNKLHKMLSGIVSLLIFVAGMGLLARLNFSHGEPWPLWVKAKIGLWFLVALLIPILNKRVKIQRQCAFWALFTIIVLAAFTAIYKPFV